MTGRPSLWLGETPLVLASGSATRAAMLRGAGVPIEIVRPEIDERVVEAPLREAGVPAHAVAVALACAKALAASVGQPGRVVLGADQVLTCEGMAFYKPVDMADAHRQIATLAARTHELHSAFVLVRDGAVLAEGAQTARLTMRQLSAGFIETYVAQAGPAALSSVGGYQIEGLGAQLFETVEGDHFSILGLPLFGVLAVLRDLDLLAR